MKFTQAILTFLLFFVGSYCHSQVESKSFMISYAIDSTIDSKDLSFLPVEGEYLRFGLIKSDIWIKIESLNSTTKNLNYYIEFSSTILDSIIKYDSSYTIVSFSGCAIPNKEKELVSNLPIFNIEPNSVNFFRISSKLDKNFSLKILKKEEWLTNQSTQLYLSITIILIAAFSSLISFVLYTQHKKKLSLYFIFLNLTSLGLIIYYQGIGPLPFYKNDIFIKFLFPLMVLSELIFTKTYFKDQTLFKKLGTAILILSIGLLTTLAFSPFIPVRFVLKTSATFNVVVWILMLIGAFKGLKNQTKSNLFYRLGISYFALSAIVFALTNSGLLPIHKFINPDFLFPSSALIVRTLLFGIGIYFYVDKLRDDNLVLEHKTNEFQQEIDLLKHRIQIHIQNPIDTQQEFKPLTIKHNTVFDEHSIKGWAQLNTQLPTPLTTRELEVLAEIAKGKTNKQIAETLFLSPNTIKTHTVKIYAKLDVSNRTEAVRIAQELL